jgi:hypothetical protein
MKRLSFFTLAFFLVSILLASCVSTANLTSPNNNSSTISVNNLEFVAHRSASAPGLTLVDVLTAEKIKFGEDIRLVNIVEQTQTTTFLIIFKKEIKYYIYDVVKMKK